MVVVDFPSAVKFGGDPEEPNEFEVNSTWNDARKLEKVRLCFLDAEGITVISRWSCVATPPDRSQTKRLHPGGMPDLLSIANFRQESSRSPILNNRKLYKMVKF